MGIAVVHAQEPLTRNDFTIDAVQTPILGSGRIVGLGGAYSALAEGIDGVPFNPAAYAARSAWELDRIEYDISLGVSFPGSFSQADLFLNGEGEGIGVAQSYFLDVGLRLQVADVGGGASFQFQTFDIEGGGLEDTTANFVQAHGGIGYSFFNGQLVAGVGIRAASLTLTANEMELVSFTGAGAEIGAIMRFTDMPFRIGVAGRTPVDSRIVSDPEDMTMPPEQIGDFVLPRSVYLPWEVQAGIAWQFGPRPFNYRYTRIKDVSRSANEQLAERRCVRELAQVRLEHEARGEPLPAGALCPGLRVRAQDPQWRAEEQERLAREREWLRDVVARGEEELEQHREDAYEAVPRRYVLVSADVLFTGRTPDGVGIDAFLAQERRTRGDVISFALRLGTEFEPWYDRMKIRVGTYLEPARYEGVKYRLHGTFNVELHPFTIFGYDIKVYATLDGARDYFNWGVGVGFWH